MGNESDSVADNARLHQITSVATLHSWHKCVTNDISSREHFKQNVLSKQHILERYTWNVYI